MNIGALFAALIAAHALCDYPLQGPFLSEAKNRFAPIPGVPWWQAMAAHAAIQGAAVGLIFQLAAGLWWLGLFEAVAHFIIDDARCEKMLSFNADQALHIICKLAWLGLALAIMHGA